MMKSALFAGVAASLLVTALPSVAAPAPADAAAAPKHEITYGEVKARADKVWDRMDANHDGRIDAADRDARLLERFAKWDTNHDGVISKDEFLAVVHARQAKWHDRRAGVHDGAPPQGHDGGDHEGWGHGGPGEHPGGRIGMAIIGRALHDARKDGVITRAAFDAAVKARFDAIDTNHDGTLTREELHAAWRDHHRAGEWGHRKWRRDGTPPPSGH